MTNLGDECIDSINHNILNRCLALVPNTQFVRLFTSNFFSIIYPHIVLNVLAIIILLLPYVFALSSRATREKALRIYNHVRVTILSFYHQMGFCFTLISFIRVFIKQETPCICQSIEAPYEYNTPYVYSVSSGLFGLTLLDYQNVKKSIFIPLGIFCIIVPSIFYILAGWASIAQALGGLFFSGFLHYISNITTNRTMLFETCIFLIINICVIIYMAVTRNYTRSPFGLLFHAITIQIYDIVLMLQFLIKNNFTFFTVSRITILEDTTNTFRSSLIDSEESNYNFVGRMSSDEVIGIVGIAILIFMNTFEFLFGGLFY